MSAPLATLAIERFRTSLARGLGLRFEDDKLEFLGEVLLRRAGRRVLDDYLATLEETSLARDGELHALAQELTIPETHFFRYTRQFRALRELLLSHDLQRRSSHNGPVRILSAGCATGEEAYSIAIVAQELGLVPGTDFTVRAVDANPLVLQRARAARFSNWALRETPPSIKDRWFSFQGQEVLLNAVAQRAVSFETANLAADAPDLFPPETYHVVFCRNVIMYFTEETARGLIARIAAALVPGGHLFLGHAETLRGLSQAFQLVHTHETFYYRLVAAEAKAQSQPAAVSAGMAPKVASKDDWFSAIQEASERVRKLGREHAPPHANSALDVTPRALHSAFELLAEERFNDALDLIQSLPEAAREPHVDLLEAVLLVQAGELSRAELVCTRLLTASEANAGALFVLGLCKNARGDPHAAIEHHRSAAYYDPSFAMPRLHLGLLARTTGDSERVRRELEQALVLLENEAPTRLLLFGGGFDRRALSALCRAELRAAGGLV